MSNYFLQSFHVFHLKYYLTFFNLNKQAFSDFACFI
ncbi:hypothetical protein PT2222_130129 [Paraburkholderia tropica]